MKPSLPVVQQLQAELTISEAEHNSDRNIKFKFLGQGDDSEELKSNLDAATIEHYKYPQPQNLPMIVGSKKRSELKGPLSSNQDYSMVFYPTQDQLGEEFTRDAIPDIVASKDDSPKLISNFRSIRRFENERLIISDDRIDPRKIKTVRESLIDGGENCLVPTESAIRPQKHY